MALWCRRLVWLGEGDMALHRYNLRHGVDVRAGTRLSLILWFNESPEDCKAKATQWKQRAAERGDANAQYQLAREYIFGQRNGGSQEGWRWLRQAAELGEAHAQLNLGLREAKRGDTMSAQAWWRKAAAQGLPEAMHNLGLSYRGGPAAGGSTLEAARSTRWLRLAAEEGDAESAQLLGGCLRFRPPCAA